MIDNNKFENKPFEKINKTYHLFVNNDYDVEKIKKNKLQEIIDEMKDSYDYNQHPAFNKLRDL